MTVSLLAEEQRIKQVFSAPSRRIESGNEFRPSYASAGEKAGRRSEET
jgi:hypothetical protein